MSSSPHFIFNSNNLIMDLDCGSLEISNIYKNDRARYEATVREWTRKYAMGDYMTFN
jgi:ubiquitin-protein ligase